jgi:capsular polysaccharide transport system permease protein
MFYFLGRGAPDGMELVTFILTGLIPFNLFREVTARAVSAVQGNKGLLFYPQIQPLDLVIARALLEAATLSVVFGVIVLASALWQGEAPSVHDWLVFMLSFAAAAALGASLGLTLAALGVFTPTVERLHGPVLRPLFWVSGVFFTANGLPPGARHVMLYNPVLHIVEFVRTGWFPGYTARYASASYVITWIICLTFFGLVLERLARRRLEVV